MERKITRSAVRRTYEVVYYDEVESALKSTTVVKLEWGSDSEPIERFDNHMVVKSELKEEVLGIASVPLSTFFAMCEFKETQRA